MKDPRQIAAEALLKVGVNRAWSNRTLDNLVQKYRPDARDVAFIGALFYGVLERQVTLDACVMAYATGRNARRMSPQVLQILRLGIYQMLYLDGVPDGVAVHQSVELAKKMGQVSAAGFVNGVLRGFLRGGKAIPLPDSPPDARFSVEYSCPQPLVALLLQAYGEEAARRFLADSLGRPPLYLRVNSLKTTAGELAEKLRGRGLTVEPDPDLPHCLAVTGTGSVADLPEYWEGLFHVQDKSSQFCVMALDAGPGMRVLDACSAPGGKALTAAQAMEDQGEIVAADLHPHRVKLVEGRAVEMGFSCIQALQADMEQPQPQLGKFDRVLCDAPCSGLGVIRRRPEIKYKPLEEFQNIPHIQYKILENTAQYCKAGGQVIYSTCTLHPAENGEVVDRFLEHHPGFAPGTLPPQLGGGDRRTMLGEQGADGFFMAALRRVKEGEPPQKERAAHG